MAKVATAKLQELEHVRLCEHVSGTDSKLKYDECKI